MDKVTTIVGVAAPLLRSNIDTDTVIRIERLTEHARHELGPYALEVLRFRQDGNEDPACVLNQLAFRDAPILLAGDNFGCGSSREGAVWALLAAGIRCVVAESFGEIFYSNCFQNGLLPIRLSAEDIRMFADHAQAGHVLAIDLRTQTIKSGTQVRPFMIDSNRREALLEGLDDISRTLKSDDLISQWQAEDRVRRPWVWEPVHLRST